jgi:hypothetical protein
MAKQTFSDVSIVHRYLDEITIFITEILHDENRAIVLACQVFEDYKKKNDKQAFLFEERRLEWLLARATELVAQHLKRTRRETQQTKAIQAALHDYPSPGL